MGVRVALPVPTLNVTYGTQDGNGWTVLASLSSGSPNQWHVDPIAGNDANPGTATQPLRTIFAGFEKIRTGAGVAGQSHWICCKTAGGDEPNWSGAYAEHIGGWTGAGQTGDPSWFRSGISSTQRHIVTTYYLSSGSPVYGLGKPAEIRPPAGRNALKIVSNSNLAFVNLFLNHDFFQTTNVANGLTAEFTVNNVLFESVIVRRAYYGMSWSVPNTDAVSWWLRWQPNKDNLVVRRCVFDECGPNGAGHGQGAYIELTNNALFEECYFFGGGRNWRATGQPYGTQFGTEAPGTIFDHNVYCNQTNRNVLFRDCVAWNGSATGFQLRANNACAFRCIALQNPINISGGTQTDANLRISNPGYWGLILACYVFQCNNISTAGADARGFGYTSTYARQQRTINPKVIAAPGGANPRQWTDQEAATLAASASSYDPDTPGTQVPVFQSLLLHRLQNGGDVRAFNFEVNTPGVSTHGVYRDIIMVGAPGTNNNGAMVYLQRRLGAEERIGPNFRVVQTPAGKLAWIGSDPNNATDYGGVFANASWFAPGADSGWVITHAGGLVPYATFFARTRQSGTAASAVDDATFVDGTRNFSTWATTVKGWTLSGANDDAKALNAIRQYVVAVRASQNRTDWDTSLSPAAIIPWIFDGYGLEYGDGGAINLPPVANAGAATLVLVDNDENGSEVVALDGTASTDDAGITSYQWDVLNIGTGAWDQVATTATHNYTADVRPEAYQFRLTVTDGDGLTGQAFKTVTVSDPIDPLFDMAFQHWTPEISGPATVQATPIGVPATAWFCGIGGLPDTLTLVPGELYPDFQWYLDDAPVGTNANTLALTTLAPGRVYKVVCVATLFGQVKASAAFFTQTLPYIPPAATNPPVARTTGPYAATDEDADGFVDITLDASPSTDPDNDIVSWNWYLADGTPLGSGEQYTHSFEVGTIPATYDVRCVVSDAGERFNIASTTVTINPAPAEVPTQWWIDGDNGNDAAPTNSFATPWKTLTKLATETGNQLGANDVVSMRGIIRGAATFNDSPNVTFKRWDNAVPYDLRMAWVAAGPWTQSGNVYTSSIGTGKSVKGVAVDFDTCARDIWGCPKSQLADAADAAACAATNDSWHYASGTGILSINLGGQSPTGRVIEWCEGGKNVLNLFGGSGRIEYLRASLNIDPAPGFGYFVKWYGSWVCGHDRTVYGGYHHGWGVDDNAAGTMSNSGVFPQGEGKLIGAMGSASASSTLGVWYTQHDNQTGNTMAPGMQYVCCAPLKRDGTPLSTSWTIIGLYVHNDGTAQSTARLGPGFLTVEGQRFVFPYAVGAGSSPWSCAQVISPAALTPARALDDPDAYGVKFIDCICEGAVGFTIQSNVYMRGCRMGMEQANTKAAALGRVMDDGLTADSPTFTWLLDACELRPNLNSSANVHVFRMRQTDIIQRSCTGIDVGESTNDNLRSWAYPWSSARKHAAYGGRYGFLTSGTNRFLFWGDNWDETAGQRLFRRNAYVGIGTGQFSSRAAYNTLAEWTAAIDAAATTHAATEFYDLQASARLNVTGSEVDSRLSDLTNLAPVGMDGVPMVGTRGCYQYGPAPTYASGVSSNVPLPPFMWVSFPSGLHDINERGINTLSLPDPRSYIESHFAQAQRIGAPYVMLHVPRGNAISPWWHTGGAIDYYYSVEQWWPWLNGYFRDTLTAAQIATWRARYGYPTVAVYLGAVWETRQTTQSPLRTLLSPDKEQAYIDREIEFWKGIGIRDIWWDAVIGDTTKEAQYSKLHDYCVSKGIVPGAEPVPITVAGAIDTARAANRRFMLIGVNINTPGNGAWVVPDNCQLGIAFQPPWDEAKIADALLRVRQGATPGFFLLQDAAQEETARQIISAINSGDFPDQLYDTSRRALRRLPTIGVSSPYLPGRR
jgi:hypothetical protein